MSKPAISYGYWESAWDGFDEFVMAQVQGECAKTICEVGGGANPTLSLEFVERQGVEYVIMDLSETELAKAPAGYVKVCRDIQKEDPHTDGCYDLVFSKMLAEHVQRGEDFHRNVLRLLREGGLAVHFFPTLYAPPFVLNALLPDRLAEWLLHLVQSGREASGNRARFPAYYSWCRGPTRHQIDRFHRLGYTVERYYGYFGHGNYYKKVQVVERLHNRFARWVVAHPVPQLTSFAGVVLRKAS